MGEFSTTVAVTRNERRGRVLPTLLAGALGAALFTGACARPGEGVEAASTASAPAPASVEATPSRPADGLYDHVVTEPAGAAVISNEYGKEIVGTIPAGTGTKLACYTENGSTAIPGDALVEVDSGEFAGDFASANDFGLGETFADQLPNCAAAVAGD